MKEYEYSMKVKSVEPFIEYCKANNYAEKVSQQNRIVFENKANNHVIARLTTELQAGKETTFLDFKNINVKKDNLNVSDESELMEVTDENRKVIFSMLDTLEFYEVANNLRTRYTFKKDGVIFEIDDYQRPQMKIVAIEGDIRNVEKIYKEVLEKNYDFILKGEEMKNKTIVLASNSEHKIKEFKEMFKGYNILSLKDIGFLDDIVEDGETFYDNALIKAKAVQAFLKEKNMPAMVIADDTGLCVDALGGMPGVYSARYAGDHDNASNRKKLLHELENVKNRSAHFTTMIVRIDPDGKVTAYEGRAEGKILTEEDGSNGFGYDSIFFSDELGKSFGTASSEEKNLVSHRGKATAKLKADLEKI